MKLIPAGRGALIAPAVRVTSAPFRFGNRSKFSTVFLRPLFIEQFGLQNSLTLLEQKNFLVKLYIHFDAHSTEVI